MSSKDIGAVLDRLAEILVLADPGDMPALAEMHTGFGELAEWASEEHHGQAAEAATLCAKFLEGIILDEFKNPQAAFDAVGESIGVYQAIVRGDAPADAAPWPSLLGLGAGAGAPAEDGKAAPVQLPAHIDESILVEFLARQGGVLEEVEGHILTLEKGPDDDAFGALKRILHTLKGESGMLGLVEVERLCHATEDTLVVRAPQEISDTLFAVKDWLGKAFEYYAGNGPAPCAASEVLVLLARATGGAAAAPEAPSASAPSASAAPAPEVAAPPAEGRPLEGDRDLLQEFVAEAGEHLDSADVHLLTLETEPKNQEALNAVFRAFHTIKGVAGFLALDEVQALAHESESLLDKARKDELELVDAAIDITFDAVDMLKTLMGRVSDALSSGGVLVPESSLPGLVKEIRAIASGEIDVRQQAFELPAAKEGQKVGEILVASGNADPAAVARALDAQQHSTIQKPIGEILVEKGVASKDQVDLAVDVQKSDPSVGRTGEVLVEMGVASDEDIEGALDEQQMTRQRPRIGEMLVQSGVDPKDVAQAVRSQQKAQQAGVKVKDAVKVDADRLDLLVDSIGELVIAESMVRQSGELRNLVSTDLARRLNQLDKITRDLQEMGTSLRMVPIRSTFQKMARLVRDLAKKAGKQVEFVTTGEDTELDKTVVDKIGDPLVHMVRNAVDHGLESSVEERQKAGKSGTGRVELRAFHKGGNIYVEIEDDGRGLDREAILNKARERGLVRENEIPSDREIYNLIFEPGFSTAKKITDVSGRGVGMDVVRRNIEALRGQVEIQTEIGRGSVFSIRLPLTLAIIDGMVVRVGGERYIIPTLSIVMSIRPEPETLSTVINRGEMLSLQGRLLPLFRLGKLFNLRDAIDEVQEAIVVVIEDEGRQTGLLVDEILGQQQIVIKSLGTTLQGIPGIAGGAIMPDGHVGLILDVSGLVRLAAEATPARE